MNRLKNRTGSVASMMCSLLSLHGCLAVLSFAHATDD